MTEKELLNWVQNDKSEKSEPSFSKEDIVTADTFRGMNNVGIKTEGNVTTIDFSKCTTEDIEQFLWSKSQVEIKGLLIKHNLRF